MRKEERRKEQRVWGKKINVSLSFFSWDGYISITFFSPWDVSSSGIKPMPPAVKARRSNHRTARRFPISAPVARLQGDQDIW